MTHTISQQKVLFVIAEQSCTSNRSSYDNHRSRDPDMMEARRYIVRFPDNPHLLTSATHCRAAAAMKLGRLIRPWLFPLLWEYCQTKESTLVHFHAFEVESDERTPCVNWSARDGWLRRAMQDAKVPSDLESMGAKWGMYKSRQETGSFLMCEFRAAAVGNGMALRWLRRAHSLGPMAIEGAARGGQWKLMAELQREGVPWSTFTASSAIKAGADPALVETMLQQGAPDDDTYQTAAHMGNVSMLTMLYGFWLTQENPNVLRDEDVPPGLSRRTQLTLEHDWPHHQSLRARGVCGAALVGAARTGKIMAVRHLVCYHRRELNSVNYFNAMCVAIDEDHMETVQYMDQMYTRGDSLLRHFVYEPIQRAARHGRPLHIRWLYSSGYPLNEQCVRLCAQGMENDDDRQSDFLTIFQWLADLSRKVPDVAVSLQELCEDGPNHIVRLIIPMIHPPPEDDTFTYG